MSKEMKLSRKTQKGNCLVQWKRRTFTYMPTDSISL